MIGVHTSPPSSLRLQGQFFFVFLCLTPIMLSTFVAVTRVYDYKHAPADINAGCFIGFTCGVLSYLMNFPSPMDPLCHLPKARTCSTLGANVTTSFIRHVVYSDGLSLKTMQMNELWGQGRLKSSETIQQVEGREDVATAMTPHPLSSSAEKDMEYGQQRIRD